MANLSRFNVKKQLVAVALALFPPSGASAYEVDCAILLCLSGGWPASAECTHARAVFIQRITPWPIEPPLQIWRCPMGAALNEGSIRSPSVRLRYLAKSGAPLGDYAASHSPETAQTMDVTTAAFERSRGDTLASELLRRVSVDISEENGTADIDVSGPEFDFIRSIKVWNILHYSHAPRGKGEVCREYFDIRLGDYGPQGEFRWTPSMPGHVPDWAIPNRSCHPGSFVRAVGVEWKDAGGNHGYEVVHY